jgi:putative two-component system response regulator
MAGKAHKGTIMVIDDQPSNLKLMEAILSQKGYKVQSFPRGRLALSAAAASPPDLILLDITMPEMDGFEVCAKLRAQPELASIPVIFLSALDRTEDKLAAFRSGGMDYVTKPFEPEEMEARIATQLKLRNLQATVERQNRNLTVLVEHQVQEIAAAQMATIFALARLADSRDNETGKHLERVQTLCALLASELRERPAYREIVSDEYVKNLCHASPLHDIGKVAIPDSILLKPGKLTPEEYSVVKTHTTRGAETLELVLDQYPNNGFIGMGIEVARSHHETWAGTGYPDGLRGNAIPLSARILAIADSYDAMRSRRSYKNAYSHKETCAVIVEESGRQFDPDLVDVFVKIQDSFSQVDDYAGAT